MVWYRQLGQAVLAGMLLGIGFVVPAMWWISFFGVVYFWWLVTTDRVTILSAWLAWQVKYLLALWWFWSVYPIDWLLIDLGGIELLGIGFYWWTAGIWLGSGGVLFLVLYRWLRQWYSRFAVWSAPVIWMVAEVFGAFVFSIMTLGPGGGIGAQFSFGFIGYHLAAHGLLLQTAAVAGVYGLTLALVGLALGAVYIYRYTSHRWVVVVGGLLLLFTSGVQFEDRQGNIVHKVAVVDTTIQPDYWQTSVGQQTKQTATEAAYAAGRAADADYVVLPEDSRLFDQSNGTSALQTLLSFASVPGDPVVVDSGRVELPDGASYLQGVVFDPTTGDLATAHKRYLVPQGEYVPALYAWLFRVVGLGEQVNYLQDTFTYVVGTQTDQSALTPRMPGVLFCFESVDPRGVRKLLAERSDLPFVAHVVSHGWFNNPRTLWPQLEAMLQVQAVWNNTYIVSAGNHTIGYTVTPRGNVVLPQQVASGQDWQVGVVEVPSE